MTSPATSPDLPTLRERGTHEQVKRALADAWSELREDHPTIVELWKIIDEREIPAGEIAEFLNGDPRIDHAHFTTWNYRKNRALGKPNYRDVNAQVQRRKRKTEPESRSA